jgi:hypothetical protein
MPSGEEAKMPEELPEIGPRQGHSIATDAFMLDLYRLVCMVSADQQVAKYAYTSHAIETLQSTFLRSEVTRILISSAVALRIQSDQRQHPVEPPSELKSDCGRLYPVWPADESAFEVLRLREACNKIIHATDFRFDVVQPYLSDPYAEGDYIRPCVYLYGTKGDKNWRAVLSVIDFSKWATTAFMGW